MSYVMIISGIAFVLICFSASVSESAEISCGKDRVFCFQVFRNKTYKYSVSDGNHEDDLISMVMVREKSNGNQENKGKARSIRWIMKVHQDLVSLSADIAFIPCDRDTPQLTLTFKKRPNLHLSYGTMDKEGKTVSVKINNYVILTNSDKHSLEFNSTAQFDKEFQFKKQTYRISVDIDSEFKDKSEIQFKFVTLEAAKLFKNNLTTSLVFDGAPINTIFRHCAERNITTPIAVEDTEADPAIISALALFIVFLLIAITGIACALFGPCKLRKKTTV